MVVVAVELSAARSSWGVALIVRSERLFELAGRIYRLDMASIQFSGSASLIT